ncbi:hypothetical protein FA10DRAFT_84354 [Acaromyces ingoldii]|uniref:Uncharacterized protein n=1 Tax=Acaromyces ingoldii TaxID=215250 RepID=A0A316YS21_9BASI|nr:hypothetical protein FA10DRAFT_84354 [Acaromyces ingoldii]PWN92109.1 hypothetical protein FA10DRAFT_84354 [Acaromyces ingoldii]
MGKGTSSEGGQRGRKRGREGWWRVDGRARQRGEATRCQLPLVLSAPGKEARRGMAMAVGQIAVLPWCDGAATQTAGSGRALNLRCMQLTLCPTGTTLCPLLLFHAHSLWSTGRADGNPLPSVGCRKAEFGSDRSSVRFTLSQRVVFVVVVVVLLLFQRANVVMRRQERRCAALSLGVMIRTSVRWKRAESGSAFAWQKG